MKKFTKCNQSKVVALAMNYLAVIATGVKYDNRHVADMIKVSAGCAVCGMNEFPCALDFDHVNTITKYRNASGKIVHLADMIKGNRYSIATVLAEIAKCRVLCANCHRIYTHEIQRKK
jgi:hypothetical protein